jgi:hypothetical protein
LCARERASLLDGAQEAFTLRVRVRERDVAAAVAVSFER